MGAGNSRTMACIFFPSLFITKEDHSGSSKNLNHFMSFFIILFSEIHHKASLPEALRHPTFRPLLV
jgi:hypothetical protein